MFKKGLFKFTTLTKTVSRNFGVKLKDFSEHSHKSNNMKLSNFVNGQWKGTAKYEEFVDPLEGHKFLSVPDTQGEELAEIVQAMKSCPRSGLHNPLKNVSRYIEYGQISRKVAESLHDPEVFEHFIKLIQRVFPKHEVQTFAEMKVTRAFFENFSGDNVRFLARGFTNPGDHDGQQSAGFRWPYGPVSIIAPFNFPLEIPVLQMMGALFMGNKVLIKVDSKVSVCIQEFLRLLHACGLPANDVVLVHCTGPNMEKLLVDIDPAMTQFTGSGKVAEHLSKLLSGRIKIEDAGFDFKILGPDVHDIENVASTSDQDAYALSGQKCSCQSILFTHQNWVRENFLDRIKNLAEQRNLKNLTISPVLTWSNKKIQEHIDNLLKIPGVEILFGGKPIDESHKIPEIYGSFRPTAIKVPLSAYKNKEHYKTIITEVFGPFQIVTEYDDSSLEEVLNIISQFSHFLTAGIASNNVQFVNKVLGHTVNGVTYAGIRARTTGAPQNHWFGPCGDPRAGGIGTPEAIKYVWSSHREIIMDTLFPSDFKITQT